MAHEGIFEETHSGWEERKRVTCASGAGKRATCTGGTGDNRTSAVRRIVVLMTKGTGGRHRTRKWGIRGVICSLDGAALTSMTSPPIATTSMSSTALIVGVRHDACTN